MDYLADWIKIIESCCLVAAYTAIMALIIGAAFRLLGRAFEETMFLEDD